MTPAMKRALTFVIVIGLAGCAGVVREVYGNGFRRVAQMEKSAPDFESIRHYSVLKYRSRNLGEVGFVNVAPSGQWALYEQVGRLLLFSAESGQAVDVTDGEFAIPRHVKWKEAEKATTI